MLKDPRFRSREAQERYLASYDERAKRWPLPSENRVVHTSYGETFIRINGPRDGEPLLLLHGLSATSLMWIPYIASWSQRYRTFALDVVGDAGRSVPAKHMGRTDYVRWLDEVLDRMELPQVRITSMSYGGWLAGQYALHAPQRLRKLVLIAPAATVLPMRPAYLARSVLSMILGLDSFWSWFFADLARSEPSAVEELIRVKRLERECLKLAFPLKPTSMTDAQIRSLKMPVLFLVGENETIYSANKAIDRLRNLAPHIKTALIAGAGHDVIRVQAEKVNTLVLEFLTAL